MPSKLIKHGVGIVLQKWLNLHYLAVELLPDKLKAKATKGLFIRECLQTQPVSAEDYSTRRTYPSRD